MALPGEISALDIQPIVAPHIKLADLPYSVVKPIFITTVRLNEQQIWANGLFQNVFMLYKLFESAGYTPFMLVDDNKKCLESKLYEEFRTIDAVEWSQKPFRLHAYVEMGMSCGPQIRNLFRDAGAKRFKLYLGNILNIDIETPVFSPTTNFCHHLVGEVETILVSPHYDFHQEYACAINKVYPSVKIAPYVWEPFYIKGQEQIYKHRQNGPYSFTIIEPNISFQKCSLVPIMICERFYRQNPNRFHEVAVVNGDKLMGSLHFKNNILPTLDIHKAGRLHMLPRASTNELAKALNTHIVIHHTVNNDYNYIFFEHLFMGFPVIHNFALLKDYGYYYEGDDISAACDLIDRIIETHALKTEAYRAMAKQLFWSFSISNPSNIKGWTDILEG
jgi:hypothetical protein